MKSLQQRTANVTLFSGLLVSLSCLFSALFSDPISTHDKTNLKKLLTHIVSHTLDYTREESAAAASFLSQLEENSLLVRAPREAGNNIIIPQTPTLPGYETPRDVQFREIVATDVIVSGTLTAHNIITGSGGGVSNQYVLKAGDTMTGNLTMANQSAIRFGDTTTGNFVSVQAPGTVPSSYFTNFPPAQGANQTTLVNDGSGNLDWLTALLQGGNTAGADLAIGTNDNFGIDFITAGNSALSINTSGTVNVLGDMVISGSLIAPFITTNITQIPEIVSVQKGPLYNSSEFNSIKEAVDSITDASVTKPYVVRVAPGLYIEDTITLKPFVSIVGEESVSCNVMAASSAQDIIVGVPNSNVYNLYLFGATDTGSAAIRFTGGGLFRVFNCGFGSSDILFRQTSDVPGISSVVLFQNCSISSDAQFTSAISATRTNAFLALDVDTFLYQVSAPNFLIKDFISFSGSNTLFFAQNVLAGALSLFSTTTTYNAFTISDGAQVRINNSTVGGFARGFYIPNTGVPSQLNLSSVFTSNNIYDVLIERDMTTGSISGQFDRNKISIPAANTAISLFFLDPNISSVTMRGPVYTGQTVDTITNISPLIEQGADVGLLTGGGLHNAGSLVITVSAGDGYLMVGMPPADVLKYITWTTQNVVLTASASQYIYVDQNGAIQTALAAPGNLTSILLGKVETSATGVLFIQNISQQGAHTANLLDNASRTAFGNIYVSGSIVTSTNNTQLAATGGQYFFGTHEYFPAGGAPIAWDAYYHDAVTTFTVVPQSNVDYQQYDNGMGLSPIPLNYYAKHELFVVGENSQEEYLLVYSQTIFATLNEAEQGDLPVPPASWSGNICPIASIIVTNTTTPSERIQQILDERPRIGFSASSVAGVTVHGNLLGLLADDHPQYLLDNGNRAMSGNLNLGTNAIVNVSTVNSVVVENHHARHGANSSQDPLDTAPAVEITDSTNGLGSSNSFARADHLHAHGNRGGGTLHSAATTVSAGFMSAQDKTYLDSLVSGTGAFVLKSGDTMTGPLVITPTLGTALTVNPFAGNTGVSIASGGSIGLDIAGGGAQIAGNVNLLTESALRLQDSGGGEYVGLKAPATITSSYTLNLPPAQGAANQVLAQSGTPGILQWINPTTGTITAVTATLPVISSGGTAPNISIQDASLTTSGAVNTSAQTFGGAKTFNNPITIAATQNQLVLQTAGSSATITTATQNVPHIYTIPNAGNDASFVMTEGAQVVNGTKAFGNTVTVPAGTVANPSLLFNGSTNTGFSAQTTNTLVISTNGSNRLSIDGTGVVTVANLGGNGSLPVRTDNNGTLSAGQIVNADVANGAAIAYSKLAALTPNEVLVSNGSGTVSASSVSTTQLGYLNGVVSPLQAQIDAKVAKAGDTMSGNLLFTNNLGIDVEATPGIDVLNIGIANANIINIGTAISTQTINIGTEAGITELNFGSTSDIFNINGLTTNINTTELNISDPLITLNTAGGAGSGANAGVEIEENSLVTGYVQTSGDRASWVAKAPATAGVVTITPGSTGFTLNQGSHDPVTLTTIGSTPNANAASLTGQQLQLQPASASFGGVVTADTQTFAGDKTFANNVIVSGTTTVAAGTAVYPGLNFAGSAQTGLSAATTNQLVLSTAGAARVTIAPAGTVAINNLSTGVVHSDVTGNLSSSLIVDSDITPATISNSKLAAISSSNVPNTIVVRDTTGSFTANIITGTFIGNFSGAVTGTASYAQQAGSAITSTSFTGALLGDVTGLQLTTSVAAVGGKTAAEVATAVTVVQEATALNIPATLVLRDNNGDFATRIMTGTATYAQQAGSTVTTSSFTGSLAGDVTGLQLTTSVAAVGGKTATQVATAVTTVQAATAVNTPNTLVLRDGNGDFAARIMTGTATYAQQAGTAVTTSSFTGSLAGDVTGTQLTTSVAVVGGKTATEVATAVTAVQAATAVNTPNTLVSRDNNGDFAANIITATFVGNFSGTVTGTASNAILSTSFSGNLLGDVTGTQLITSVAAVGGKTATEVATTVTTVQAATALNTANSLVLRDSNGDFATRIMTGTATYAQQAGSAITSTSFSGNLLGDVTGTQLTTSVAVVGGKTATEVATAVTTVQAATAVNTPNTLVLRDSNGDFAANIITATFVGNFSGTVTGTASNAILSTSFSGNLLGDVTGTQLTTSVAAVGGKTATQVATAVTTVQAATSTNTPNTLVLRDSNGDFATRIMTGTATYAQQAGNASNAVLSTSFSGNLLGDVTGTQLTTSVAAVGGKTATEVATAVTTVQAATAVNTPNTLVLRDSNGDFATRIMTGTATYAQQAGSAVTSIDFTGSLSGDVTGLQVTTSVAAVGGKTATEVATAVTTVQAATAMNTPNTLVVRDSSGNFAANIITATVTNATTAGNFTGSLSGDVTGTQGNTVVAFVGGQAASYIAAGAVLANNATNTNTPNEIVKRDGSGNFVAGTIQAALTGNVTGNLFGNATTATNATTAVNFSGPLGGDVIGNQNTTQVSTVGGQTATAVAAATVLANAANSANTPNAIVRRNGTGGFSAGIITATFVGNVTGNVTGNLTGNADTATTALTANSATNFTGSLAGDVSGTQGATVVNTVGGQSAMSIAATVTIVGSATNNDQPNSLVWRDGLGNFATNMITLDGAVTHPTDAATKDYVDSAVSTGFTVHDPVIVTSISTIVITGTQTIDDVGLNVNDRVLLTAQTNPVENGIWLVQVGAWIRPVDFNNGDTAGAAYVLTTSGTALVGTSWVCTTPTAIIGTDPLFFAQFSLQGQTTAVNVGAGVGQIFRDKTGNILNLKTLAAGSHVVITNNANDITLATDGTSLNNINTLVARDSSGNFAANIINAPLLTGAAALNVLKTGDFMTGNLTMTNQSSVRWGDTTGNFVGLNAPLFIPSSYTVNLPANAPAVGQVLQAASANALQWATSGGVPLTVRKYYVAKNGNDTNDGSFNAPFLTIAHAISVANGVASLTNPVVISIGAGVFVENNSGGPLAITASGITLVGNSITGTLVIPSTPSNHLFSSSTSNLTFLQMTLTTNPLFGTSTASALSLAAGAGNGGFQSIIVSGFQTGLSLASTGTTPLIVIADSIFLGNGTAISSNNVRLIVETCPILGDAAGVAPLNTAIAATGTTALVTCIGNSIRLCALGIWIDGGANVRILSNNFEKVMRGVVATGGSNTAIIGCNFIVNDPSSVNVDVFGANTILKLNGTNFEGRDESSQSQGIAIRGTQQAMVLIDACSISNAMTAIQCGTTGDTSTTVVNAVSVGLESCVTDIVQAGSSTLSFFGGTFEQAKLNIENATNVGFAAFNSTAGSLALGTGEDEIISVYQVRNGQPILPELTYEPSYYGSKGTIYRNMNSNATCNGTQSENDVASYYVVTGDRTKESSLHLMSDSGAFGVDDNTRGWHLIKTGTQADLIFSYSNSDNVNQLLRGQNTVMKLNGFDNQVEFPLATNTPLPTNSVARLIWAGDTNLYRVSSNTLKTDGNFAIGGLSTVGVVHNDASGNLSTSLIVNADVDPAAAIVDTKLATISTAGKVANSATTATAVNTPSSIVLRDGSGNFTANIITATFVGNFSGTVTGTATNAILSTSFSGNLLGDVTGTQLTTSVAAVGGKTATQVATAVTSVQAATSANTPNTLVLRDGSGAFAGSLTGAASLNVLKAGDTMTGTLNLNSASGNSLVVSGSTQLNNGSVTVGTFNTAGIVHNSSAGLLSTSLIVNADVDPTAAIVDTKLATISTAGKVANSATTATAINTPSTIVLRDGSGNFAANIITATFVGNFSGTVTGTASNAILSTSFSGNLLGDVTGTQLTTSVAAVGGKTATQVATAVTSVQAATSANTPNTLVLRDGSGAFAGSLTGAASLNVLKSGDTMTGTLNLNATSGNSLVVSGSTQLNNGSVTVGTFNTAGVVHNSSAGLLSTSLIVNADVSASAGIVDTKLATINTAGKVANSATTATSANTPSTIVLRDSSGNFTANIITATFVGNFSGTVTGTATNAILSTSFSGNLLGDVTGTQLTTSVAAVGGKTATQIATAVTTVQAATSANTPNTLVLRDGSGAFAGSLTGAASFNVLKSGDTMTGTLNLNATSGNSLVVSGSTQLNNGSVTVGTFNTAGVVHNSSAGLLSTSLIVNADVDPTAAIVDTKLATISTAGKVANSATTATSANTPSTIVLRDGSGNFTANIITATFVGNFSGTVTGTASNAILSTSFSGNLLGDVTGTQLTTSVAAVGGKTATQVATAVTTVQAATSTNTPNTLVLRDGSGAFAGSLTGAASLNVLKAGDTMTGTLNLNSVSGNSLVVSGSTQLNNGSVTIGTFNTAGVVHNSSAGLLSTSQIVNADVSVSAAIDYSKLAALTINRALVSDGSGFVSVSPVTSSQILTLSTVSGNIQDQINNKVSRSGDTMTGSLTLPAGTAAAPSINFTGSPTTGLSVATANNLVLSTNAAGRFSIDASGATTIAAPTTGTALTVNGGPATALIVTPGTNQAGITITGNGTASAVQLTQATAANAGNALVVQGSIQAANPAVTITQGGTANAQSALAVNGGSNTTAALVTLTAGSTSSGAALNVTSAAGTGNAATFAGNASAPTVSITSNAAQNALVTSLGTATTPAYAFSGNTNTGMYSPAANQVGFATGGTLRLTITNGGVIVASLASGVTLPVKADASGALIKAAIVDSDVAAGANINANKIGTGAVSTTVFNYLQNVTSDIQSQLNAKVASVSVTAPITNSGTATAPIIGITDAGAAQSGAVTAGTQTFGGAKTFNTAVSVSATSNQLVLNSAGNSATINASGQAAARIYTIPEVGANADFVLTEGTQTINGAKTFGNDVTVPAGTTAAPTVNFSGSTTTGLSAQTANTLVLSTNANGRMTLDANGGVSITAPTTATTTALQVNAASNAPAEYTIAPNSRIPQTLSNSTATGNVTVGATPTSVVLQGNYAYVVDATPQLKVIDISNPASPTQVGSVATQAAPQSVAIQSNYAFVVNNSGTQRLEIFDVSAPASPTSVGTLAITGGIRVQVQGRYAYVLTSGNNIVVVDIAAPATPALISTFATGQTNVRNFDVQGNFAVVVANNGGNASIRPFNISNPFLLIAGTATAVGAGTTLIDIKIQGNLAFTLDQTNNTLRIYNLFTGLSTAGVASAPVLVNAAFALGATNTTPVALDVQGQYVYIVNSGGTQALRIIDISNPGAPVASGAVTLTSVPPTAVAVQNNYAFVLNSTTPRLSIFANSTLVALKEGVKIQGGTPGLTIDDGNGNFATALLGDRCIINGTLRLPNIVTNLLSISDKRVKQNITPIDPEESLAKITTLEPQTYEYTDAWKKHNAVGNKVQRGFIAQEMQQVFPDLVTETQKVELPNETLENVLSIAPTGILADLVGAIKALDAKVKKQSVLIEGLLNKIEEQAAQLCRCSKVKTA